MDAVLVVSVREVGASAEQLEVIGELLRDELLNLDGSSVQRLADAPSAAGGADQAALGSLRLSLPAAPGRLARVVEVVCGWLERSRQVSGPRSVRLEADGDVLDLGQSATEEQNRQIDAWLHRRHTPAVTARTGGTTDCGGLPPLATTGNLRWSARRAGDASVCRGEVEEADHLANLAIGIEGHDIGATGNGRLTFGGELPAPPDPVVVLGKLTGECEAVSGEHLVRGLDHLGQPGVAADLEARVHERALGRPGRSDDLRPAIAGRSPSVSFHMAMYSSARFAAVSAAGVVVMVSPQRFGGQLLRLLTRTLPPDRTVGR